MQYIFIFAREVRHNDWNSSPVGSIVRSTCNATKTNVSMLQYFRYSIDAGDPVAKACPLRMQFTSCRCSSPIGQTHWSWMASLQSLICRWVVGETTVHERLDFWKMLARWVPKNFTKYLKKNHIGPSCKHSIRYSFHGERFLQCIDADETCKNLVTPKKPTERSIFDLEPLICPAQKDIRTMTSVEKIRVVVFYDHSGDIVTGERYCGALEMLRQSIRRKKTRFAAPRPCHFARWRRAPYSQPGLWLVHGMRPSDCGPSSRSRADCLGLIKKQLIGKRFETDPDLMVCHILATDTWHRFLVRWGANLDDNFGEMLKCQQWLRGGLMCTMCYPCAMCTSKSEQSFRHVNVCYLIF